MRIHLVVRIPHSLELAEGVHQLRTEHLGQQSTARLPVAVLSGKRTTVTDDQVGSPLDELAIVTNARFALQIKADPHVDTAMPEVAVKRALIAILVHERANI